jgi:pimeloyl-ACP methyl ester carboxylesterase
LKSIGPPPWKTFIPQWPAYKKAEELYQGKLVTAPEPAMQISAGYAGAAERKQYSEAEDFSQLHFFTGREPKTPADFAKLPMSGPMNKVDLPALGTDFKIPIYVVQGQNDLTALPELAKAYVDSLKAPRKQFYLVPGTGHEPTTPLLDLSRKILLEQVKPLTK